MSQTSAVAIGRSPFRSASIAVLCCSLLVLLLPSVVAGLSISSDAQHGELARVQRIVEHRPPAQQLDSSSSRIFHTAAIATAKWPAEESAQRALLVRARLAQLLGVAGVAFLVYLSVLLARGRLQALLACGLMAVLPPVSQAGHVLRPETPATMFALLSLLLLQVASRPAPQDRHRSPFRSRMIGFGLMLCASLAAAMACEALPSFGATLLVPWVVLLAGTCQLAKRGVRCLRRRTLYGTPIPSINRRLIPWTATALAAPAITWWLLSSSLTGATESFAVTERASALWPQSMVGYAIAVLLLLTGLVAAVLRVGLQLGRGGRIGPELILLVYCSVFLMTGLATEKSMDPFPLMPAVAILLSEGLRALLFLALGMLARRRS